MKQKSNNQWVWCQWISRECMKYLYGKFIILSSIIRLPFFLIASLPHCSLAYCPFSHCLILKYGLKLIFYPIFDPSLSTRVSKLEQIINKACQMEREEQHWKNRRNFAILAIIMEVIIIFMYGFFLRTQPNSSNTSYPAYQDINVMMLIGFGFLMTFIKANNFSALSYTFFINAIVVQLYLLYSAFWNRVFTGGWEQQKIYVYQRSFIAASYAVAAQLIAFGALLGKVGPFELLVMSILGTFAYSFNQTLVYEVLHTFDAGGSTTIHVFGAYFGLSVSRVLSAKMHPSKSPETTYLNSTITMIGTLFLWMFWPSFNAGYFPVFNFQRSLIITNTIVSLTGSCISTFIISALFRRKFSMSDILNSSLAGGVIVGASSGLATNPTACLIFGLFAGIVSTFGGMRLNSFLDQKIGLNDTCGVHTLHGIPGILGGIFSSIVIAAYQSDPLEPQFSYVSFEQYRVTGRDYSGQAGIQIAATAISLALGIIFGLIVGAILYPFYNFESQQFYEDRHHFIIPEQEAEQLMQESPRMMNPLKRFKSQPPKPQLPKSQPPKPQPIKTDKPQDK